MTTEDLKKIEFDSDSFFIPLYRALDSIIRAKRAGWKIKYTAGGSNNLKLQFAPGKKLVSINIGFKFLIWAQDPTAVSEVSFLIDRPLWLVNPFAEALKGGEINWGLMKLQFKRFFDHQKAREANVKKAHVL